MKISDPVQDEVIAFLGDGSRYDPPAGNVERLETHGAVVLLAGDRVLKLKKAVRFAYMDFSTLDLRRRACLREFEINRSHAPEIYLRVVAVTREHGGKLAIGGAGCPVEWCVEMQRFPQSDLLSEQVLQRGLAAPLCDRLTEAVYRYHQASAIVEGVDMKAKLAGVADEIRHQLGAQDGIVDADRVAAVTDGVCGRVEQARDLLGRRSASGFVRRVHGDLHLGNIVIWKGAPVMFDAIEFDEAMATIDTLYDLAFLLMDLDHRGHRDNANRILSRYLWLSRDPLELEALSVMPALLSLRAGVRAMVTAQRAAQEIGARRDEHVAAARAYLDHAVAFLTPAQPRLVAVGGLSGTGKSTLSAMLAPSIGPSPGAVHLRTDLERKALFECAETERLPAESYTAESSRRVYGLVLDRAALALKAGHAVVVDAVFAAPEERASIEKIATQLGVPFTGLWLDAPPAVLHQRVANRRGDASDATVEVLGRQLTFELGPMGWTRLDAGGTLADTCRAALAAVQGRPGDWPRDEHAPCD